jgi:hypothetical protein
MALLLLVGVGAPRAATQESKVRLFKSVYGTLDGVDAGQGAVIMQSETGERLAWRVSAPVVEGLGQFEIGGPMIVICRPITATEKKVTAIAFPGTAERPTYVNLTGNPVLVHFGPKVDGTCVGRQQQPTSEVAVLDGGEAEIADGCWCCAPMGQSCTPLNETGHGRALLVSCFD